MRRPAARFHTRLENGLILPEGRLGWMLAVVGTALGAYFTGDATTLSMAIGAVVQVTGGLLLIAALRAFGAGERLVSHGPYRWVRHPFYLRPAAAEIRLLSTNKLTWACSCTHLGKFLDIF